MNSTSTYFLLIDIGLFLITIFIILFYRQLDKKDRQIHLVKTLMENMQDELDEKFKKMRTTVESMEDSVQGQILRGYGSFASKSERALS